MLNDKAHDQPFAQQLIQIVILGKQILCEPGYQGESVGEFFTWQYEYISMNRFPYFGILSGIFSPVQATLTR
jgi:hypothetical protein